MFENSPGSLANMNFKGNDEITKTFFQQGI
jgi:hypothetical protein